MRELCLAAVLLAAPSGWAQDARVDELFRDFARPGVPGASVLVIQQGKAVVKKAYGLANLEQKVAATTRTNYRLASCTKQFTAMAVMMLAERGKLSYDQKLTDFFPDAPAWGQAITVRHLLTHNSGLADYEAALGPQFTRENQIKDRQVIEVLKKQTATKFEPGSRYAYSNSGYAVLALIVEKTSGMSFAAYLKKNIFDALGMKNTVAHEEGTSVVRNRAYGYSKRGDAFERTDQSATSAVLGDGGVYSSVEDLFRWDQALYGTRLVKRETWREAVTPAVLSSGKPTTYGFGWFIGTHNGHPVWHHGGGTMGFVTYIARFPEDRLTVIVLFNRVGVDPGKIAFQIAGLYLPK